MISADREAFARMLYALGDTFNEPVSELRAEAYFDALSDLPVTPVLNAGRRALAECRFFPRPVELRELIGGSVEDRAELAWNRMRSLVRRFGYWQTPSQDDWQDAATYRAAMELYGGWKALCERLPSDGPELLGYRKQFVAAYSAHWRQDRIAELPPSHDEARQRLRDVKANLVSRGLPTGDL